MPLSWNENYVKLENVRSIAVVRPCEAGKADIDEEPDLFDEEVKGDTTHLPAGIY